MGITTGTVIGTELGHFFLCTSLGNFGMLRGPWSPLVTSLRPVIGTPSSPPVKAVSRAPVGISGDDAGEVSG